MLFYLVFYILHNEQFIVGKPMMSRGCQVIHVKQQQQQRFYGDNSKGFLK